MNSDNTSTVILLIQCPDQQGLIAAVTRFIASYGGNIVSLEQHVDPDVRHFFMRLEWSLEGFTLSREDIGPAFQRDIAGPLRMTWTLHFSDRRPRIAVFVSKIPHCLYDILARHQSGEWPVDLPLIISNHDTLRPVAEQYGVPFHVFPMTPDTKPAQEARELALLQEHRVDVVVLARYMQTLTSTLINEYTHRIINIHHSFLPAFPGAKAYHSAYERGVKIIGVTSHYVTESLDSGPIIEQDVVRVSHQDTIKEMIREGQDLEKVVLARAVWKHVQHKTLVYGNRTIVFA